MIEIHPASMLALMVLLHLIADYTLQGCLANLKQKRWWEDNLTRAPVPDKDRYRHDYACGLVCHGLYWSLVVCLPLLLVGGCAYAANALIQGLVHACIDDQKANRFSLNLIEDQALHAVQIICIWGVWLSMT